MTKWFIYSTLSQNTKGHVSNNFGIVDGKSEEDVVKRCIDVEKKMFPESFNYSCKSREIGKEFMAAMLGTTK